MCSELISPTGTKESWRWPPETLPRVWAYQKGCPLLDLKYYVRLSVLQSTLRTTTRHHIGDCAADLNSLLWSFDWTWRYIDCWCGQKSLAFSLILAPGRWKRKRAPSSRMTWVYCNIIHARIKFRWDLWSTRLCRDDFFTSINSRSCFDFPVVVTRKCCDCTDVPFVFLKNTVIARLLIRWRRSRICQTLMILMI